MERGLSVCAQIKPKTKTFGIKGDQNKKPVCFIDSLGLAFKKRRILNVIQLEFGISLTEKCVGSV